MPPSRRFDKYPQLTRILRAMSDGQRDTVAHWHRVLLTALEGYTQHAKQEVKMAWGTRNFQRVAKEGAEIALGSWLNTMRDVAGLIVDPSAADWCCALGMMASPEPCPQHGFHVDQDYELGTILEREYGHGKENAVCVRGGDTQKVWRSVQFPLTYSTVDIGKGCWRVVGRA